MTTGRQLKAKTGGCRVQAKLDACLLGLFGGVGGSWSGSHFACLKPEYVVIRCFKFTLHDALLKKLPGRYQNVQCGPVSMRLCTIMQRFGMTSEVP